MANICTFELRVKGARNAAMAVAHSMPNLSAVIRARREAGGVTEIILTGACNWSVNYGVSDQWTWPDCDAVLPGLDEAGVAAHANRIYGCSLKSKSRYLHCEIAVHYWSEESGFDSFDLYRDGYDYYIVTHAHPNSTFRYTKSSLPDLFAFDASADMYLISQPLLMIAGSVADTFYMTEQCFSKATGTKDKELFLIPGATHIKTYYVPEYVNMAVEKLTSFFNDRL